MSRDFLSHLDFCKNEIRYHILCLNIRS
jgi:hypothetical protein